MHTGCWFRPTEMFYGDKRYSAQDNCNEAGAFIITVFLKMVLAWSGLIRASSNVISEIQTGIHQLINGGSSSYFCNGVVHVWMCVPASFTTAVITLYLIWLIMPCRYNALSVDTFLDCVNAYTLYQRKFSVQEWKGAVTLYFYMHI